MSELNALRKSHHEKWMEEEKQWAAALTTQESTKLLPFQEENTFRYLLGPSLAQVLRNVPRSGRP